MSRTTTQQDGHRVDVDTKEIYSGVTERKTYVDGKCESITRQTSDGTNVEHEVNHNVLTGPSAGPPKK